jgi:ATP-dependent exoDNAse (exonuclease V) beta subunit
MNTQLADAKERTTALTAIDRTLLVEAGAGSGKTSVMAGRVAVLFANGVEPKNIAAITFTEFAASELEERIERFTRTLAGGHVPKELRDGFANGLSAGQRANVERALQHLDQLACTTIHGFAQRLVAPYPAEAGIDPGAGIIEPAEAALAFQERYEAWLKARLSGTGADNIVGHLVLADEKKGLELLKGLAEFLVHHRDAAPAASSWSAALAAEFFASAKRFKLELQRLDFLDEDTQSKCDVFLRTVEALGGLDPAGAVPTDRELVAALRLPRESHCFTEAGSPRKYQGKGRWQHAAKAAGRSAAEGDRAFNAARHCYDSCHDALAALQQAAASELLARLAVELRSLFDDWQAYKRGAALLDFGDLLYTARDLLRDHPAVRRALAERYTHVLVDEFQDTDPLQIEILWLLCGDDAGANGASPLERPLRRGALFLVGDPKQAIYRFRGADVAAYVAARDALGKDAFVSITTNFRSVEPILSFVNARFEGVLSEAAGQPGFSALSSFRPAREDGAAVLALEVDAVDGNASAIRDAEAECVAGICSRLVGNLMVHEPESDTLRACRYGDIALLAPAGTELWRFEEALETLGIPVATQAGKGFFRRQEVQDLVAVARVLADSRDTLALGALLRGPLVGLTEAELLDIAEALPVDPARPDRLPQLRISTDPAIICHPLAASVVEKLASLRRRSRSTTPYALLCDAIAELRVRPLLRQRFAGGAERALANVDLFLEMARSYDVRGLRGFAAAMRANWEEAERQAEGRPDAEEQSISLITIHSAKGLEWPVVIPINMTGSPQGESGVLHDRRGGVFSMSVLGIDPAGHEKIKEWNRVEHERERVRLWYVAATRARDFLVLPRHGSALPAKCWAQIVDLGLSDVDALDPAHFGGERSARADSRENGQTRDIFAREAEGIAAGMRKVAWRMPSRHEANADGDLRTEPSPVFAAEDRGADAAEIPVPVAGSTVRGVLLHKLMEEVLLGVTGEGVAPLESRAHELLAQLGVAAAAEPSSGISPAELAATVVRTLELPAIRALRPRLVPEVPVFSSEETDGAETLLSGVADAIAVDGDRGIEAVLDWKSDVGSAPSTIERYQKQIGAYRDALGAKRAMLVMMTHGTVIEL